MCSTLYERLFLFLKLIVGSLQVYNNTVLPKRLITLQKIFIFPTISLQVKLDRPILLPCLLNFPQIFSKA